MVTRDQSGIAIFQDDKGNPVPMPQDRKSGRPHIAFRVSMENFLGAREHLENNGVEYDFQDHYISHSIYFRDPDDYCIELTTYEIS